MKVVGVEAALDRLGAHDPLTLVMGDSKPDVWVMDRVEKDGAGIATAPEHPSLGTSKT